MNCAVCGNLLSVGTTVFRCSCGVTTHAQCRKNHTVEPHKHHFTTGTVTVHGEFVPKSANTEQPSHPAEKESVALPSKTPLKTKILSNVIDSRGLREKLHIN